MVSITQKETIKDVESSEAIEDQPHQQAIVKKVPTTMQTVTLKGCSLPEVNGRYMESGYLHGTRKFSNVNGWNVFRYALEEIPEMDILASNCYPNPTRLPGDDNVMEKLSKRTGSVVSELITPGSNISEGTADFKRRFGELSRTGTRMITVDNQSNIMHVENIRANVRIKNDQEALFTISLAASAVREIERHGSDPNDDESDILHVANEIPPNSPVKITRVNKLLNDSSHAGDLIPNEESCSFIEAQSSNGSETKAFDSNTTLQVLLSKSVNYQSSNQSFHHITQKSRRNISEESQTSVEVLRNIEIRESILAEIQHESVDIERRYQQMEELSNIINYEKVFSRLLDLFEKLREATINVVEAIGAWGKVANELIERKKETPHYMKSADELKSAKKYVVMVCRKGNRLYDRSEALTASNSHLFRRGQETALHAVTMDYVGVYETKEKGILAFEQAIKNIPLEQQLNVEGVPGKKMFIGLRSCRKHYLIRSAGVSPDIPCEQCLTTKASQSTEYVPKITSHLFPQYLWHGTNYLDKLWTDLQFLQNISLMKDLNHIFDYQYNPLLLSKTSYNSLLNGVIQHNTYQSSHHIGEVNSTTDYMTDFDTAPLLELKSCLAVLEDAQRELAERLRPQTPVTLKGLPYRLPGTLPDLDKDYSSLSKKKAIKSSTNLLNNVHGAELLRATTSADFSNLSEDDNASRSTIHTNTLSDITSRSYLDDFPSNSKKLPPLTTTPLGLSSTYGYDSAVGRNQLSGIESTLENQLINYSSERLKRSLLILGQSFAMKKEKILSGSFSMALDSPSLPTETNQKASLPKGKSVALTKNSRSVMSRTAGSVEQGAAPNLVSTTVPFEYLGATLTTQQLRHPVSFRDDTIWCRQDVGEWSSMKIMGREMKKWYRRDKFLEEAKRKTAEREEIQRLIKAALSYDFLSCRPEEIEVLIQRGEKYRGSVIELDLRLAEQFLQSRKRFIKSLIGVQKVIRGFISKRRYFRAMREKTLLEKKRKQEIYEICLLTRQFVQDCVASGLKKSLKRFSDPQFTVGSNYGGLSLVVSVFLLPRGLRKPSQSLCDSCLAKSTVIRYNPFTDVRTIERSPCTCVLIQGPERWRIQAYDPITSEKFIRDIDPKDYQSLLVSGYLYSLQSPSEHLKALYGDSFQSLETLLMNSTTSATESDSLLQASRQYAVLARLPKRYTADMLFSLNRQMIPPMYTSLFQSHRLRSTQNPLSVDDIQLLGDDISIQNCKNPPIPVLSHLPDQKLQQFTWQPLYDNLYYKFQHCLLSQVLPTMIDYSQSAVKAYEAIHQKVQSYILISLEPVLMEYEDALSRCAELLRKYDAAAHHVRDVMKFSKYKLLKFELEQQGEAEDWDQPWEGVENANRWQGLNDVRKLRVLIDQQRNTLQDIEVHLQLVRDQYKVLLIEELRCKKLVQQDTTLINNYGTYIEETRNHQMLISRIIREICSAVICNFVVPHYINIKHARRLRLLPDLHGVYVRTPLRRVEKSLRSLWDTVYRKFHLISSATPMFNSGLKYRCVVTVYRDPIYKTLIIQLAGDESQRNRRSDNLLCVEENNYHLDLGLEDNIMLSGIVKYNQQNEIILCDQDVATELLKKSHIWPNKVSPQSYRDQLDAIVSLDNVSFLSTSAQTGKPSPEKIPPKKKKKNPSTKHTHDTPSRLKKHKTTSSLHLPVQSSTTLSTSGDTINRSKTEDSSGTSIDKSVDLSPGINTPLPSSRVAVSRMSTVVISHNTFNGMKPVPPKGYLQRRRQLVADETSLIDKILQYLRIHPHSRRPCLGFIHFIRRSKFILSLLKTTLWWTDHFHLAPPSWVNDVPSKMSILLVDKQYQIKFRELWGSLELNLRTIYGSVNRKGYEINVHVPCISLLESLQSKPLLFASYLCEVMTNRYSTDVLRHALLCLDTALPGENVKKGWRRALRTENVPVISFEKEPKMRYRGPLYSMHRFVSHIYCRVQVYESCSSDLKITLSPPVDGQFPLQSLASDSVVLWFDRATIKALILKLSNIFSNSVVAFRLYHAYFLHDLVNTLLDIVLLSTHLRLETYRRQSLIQDVSCQDSHKDETFFHNEEICQFSKPTTKLGVFEIDQSHEEENPEITQDKSGYPSESLWKDRLHRSIGKVIQAYNKWISDHKYPTACVDENLSEDIFARLEAYYKVPDWKIQNEWALQQSTVVGQVPGNSLQSFRRHKIVVYDGFFPAIDPRQIPRVVSQFTTHSQGDSEIKFCGESYWRVLVSTNETKSRVSIELKETGREDPFAAMNIASEELKLMTREDCHSHQAARVLVNSMMLREEAERKFYSPSIPDQYVMLRLEAQEKVILWKSELRKMQSRLLRSVDALFEKISLCNYKIGLESLRVDRDSSGVKFSVNTEDASELCRKNSNISGLSLFGYSNFVSSQELSDIYAKNQMIYTDFMTWLRSVDDEIYSCGCTEIPKIYAVVSNLVVKAYPGIPPIYRQSVDVNGSSSAQGVLNVHSQSNKHDHHPPSFRDPKAWSRYRPIRSWETGPLAEFDPTFLRRAQKGSKPKYMKFDSCNLLISAPHVGPFDLCSIHAYNPHSREKFIISFQSQFRLPSFCIPEIRRQSRNEIASDDEDEVDGEANISDNDEESVLASDNGSEFDLVKFCAERVVWRSLFHGITKMVCLEAERRMDDSLQKLEAHVAYNCTQWLLPSPKVSSRETSVETSTEREALYKLYGPSILHKNLSSMRSVVPDGEILSESPLKTFPTSSLFLYSVFCPADEDSKPIPFEKISSIEWEKLCYRTMHCNPISLTRKKTLPLFIYCQSPQEIMGTSFLEDNCEPNLKVTSFVREYFRNIGWKKPGLEYLTLQRRIANTRNQPGFVDDQEILGDVLILFRSGKYDFDIFLQYCEKRYQERQQYLDQKRRKEIEELSQRKKNFRLWKDDLVAITKEFLPSFEKCFCERTVFAKYSTLSTFQTKFIPYRITVSHIRALINLCETYLMSNADEVNQCILFLNDRFMTSDDDLFRCVPFQLYTPLSERDLSLNNNTIFDERYFNFESISLQLPEIHPLLLLLALYQQHCATCSLSLDQCPIPCCNAIRGMAKASLDSYNEIDAKTLWSNSVEAAVAHFMQKNSFRFESIILPTTRRFGERVVEENELQPPDSQVPLAVSCCSSKLSWKSALKDAVLFRYLNRRILYPNITSLLSPVEILEAIGGHDYREELQLQQESFVNLDQLVSQYLPNVDPSYAGFNEMNHISTIDRELLSLMEGEKFDDGFSPSKLHETPRNHFSSSYSKQIPLSIPTKILKKMQGGFVKNSRSPVEMYDPCPSRLCDVIDSSECEDGRIQILRLMSENMFHWLLKHLYISRPSNNYHLSASVHSNDQHSIDITNSLHHHQVMNQSSQISTFQPFLYFSPDELAQQPSLMQVDQSAFTVTDENPNNFALLFDRLYVSGPLVLADGSYIMIQVLHGVLIGYNMEISQESGCPDFGKRYLPETVLEDLSDGLTIQIYDFSSNITKIIALEGMKLQNLLRHYDLLDEDYPEIAAAIMKYAPELIILHRLSTGLCVDATLQFPNVDIPSKSTQSERIHNQILLPNLGESTGDITMTYQHINCHNAVYIPKINMKSLAATYEQLLDEDHDETEENFSFPLC